MSQERDCSQDRPPEKLFLQWYVDPTDRDYWELSEDGEEFVEPSGPMVADPEDRTYSQDEPVYKHDVLYERARWISVGADNLPRPRVRVLLSILSESASESPHAYVTAGEMVTYTNRDGQQVNYWVDESGLGLERNAGKWTNKVVGWRPFPEPMPVPVVEGE